MQNPERNGTALSSIRNLDYTVIFCRDMAAMVDFYQNVMEFELDRRLSDSWVEFRIGAAILALGLPGGRFPAEPVPPQAAALQLAFRVPPPAVQACADALRAKGIEPLEPVADQPFGHRTLFFRDPDGNLLEIYAEI